VIVANHGPGGLRAIAFSPDSGTLATTGKDGVVRLWDVFTLTERLVLRGHEAQVRCVTFSPDGRALVSVDDGGRIKMWDPATGTEDPSFRTAGHAGEVHCARFAPDGQAFATSGGTEQTIRLWDRQTGRLRAEMKPPLAGHMALAFSPDGDLLAAGQYYGAVTIWDVSGIKFNRSTETPSLIPAGALSPKAGRAASSIPGGTPEKILFHTGWRASHIFTLAFSPDGRTLITGEAGGVRFWDVDGLEERFIFPSPPLPGKPTPAAVSPDGKFLATGSSGGAAYLWDVRRDEPPERAFVPAPTGTE
jgi:WD40 repeat protein